VITIQNPIRKISVSQRGFTNVVTSPYKIAILFECKHFCMALNSYRL